MSSRAGALIAPPSWGRAAHPQLEEPEPSAEARGPRVRWGIRASAAADVAGGVAILAATAGLWAAVLLAAW